MYHTLTDNREPLESGHIIRFKKGNFIIDRLAGRGGFAFTYIAHEENKSVFFAMKELFPLSVGGLSAKRRADGKIVLVDPFSDEEADQKKFEACYKQLMREIEYTKAASTVWSDVGAELQNDPDVLPLFSPEKDDIGNTYLLIATCHGESLEEIIESGRSGENLPNSRLGDVIEILMRTAIRLDKLHGDKRIWHLDLSPSNIWVAHTAGGSELTPFIIDYGSARYSYEIADMASDAEEGILNDEGNNDLIFTSNAFSAPEIKVLASLGRPDPYYIPDESSDTYSLGAILYYAVTGEYYKGEIGSGECMEERFKKIYPDELFSMPSYRSLKAFSSFLYEFFYNSMNADQKSRYKNLKRFFKGLDELKEAYSHAGRPLAAIPEDELISYLILDKYPLYDYSDGDLNVLIVGLGKFSWKMIKAMLSIGQMIGRKLNINVVGKRKRSFFENRILEKMPELKNYADFNGNGRSKYVNFNHLKVKNPSSDDGIEQILEKSGECRYVVVSLYSNEQNISTARKISNRISREKSTIIHYFMDEDISKNVRSDVPLKANPNVFLNPVECNLTGYMENAMRLCKIAFKLKNHNIQKIGNKLILDQMIKKFNKNQLDQLSAAVSALHIKYKLKSISADPTMPPEKINELIDQNFDKLVSLEHNCWMMFVITKGYERPKITEIENYAFCNVDMTKVDNFCAEYQGEKFNDSFVCESKKKHPAIVPCTEVNSLKELPKSMWDSMSNADIFNYTGDELDRTSIRLHQLSGRIADHRMTLIHFEFENILKYRIKNAYSIPNDIKLLLDKAEQELLLMDKSDIFSISRFISSLFNLCMAMRSKTGIDITSASHIFEHFRVFGEFAYYRDYKDEHRKTIRKIQDLISDHLLY